MRRPLLIDLRNICEPKDVVKQGMEIYTVGQAEPRAAYGSPPNSAGRNERRSGGQRAYFDSWLFAPGAF